MAHFAKVYEGKVVNVIVAELDFFDSFIDNSPGEWVQCSYNTRGGVHYSDLSPLIPSEDQSKVMRYNYPGLGYNYDKESDAFYADSPFPSWTLNKNTYLWEPPVSYPSDGAHYDWNEENQSWQPVT